MALYLIVVPLIGALAAFLLPADRLRPWVVASVVASNATHRIVRCWAMATRLVMARKKSSAVQKMRFGRFARRRRYPMQ